MESQDLWKFFMKNALEGKLGEKLKKAFFSIPPEQRANIDYITQEAVRFSSMDETQIKELITD